MIIITIMITTITIIMIMATAIITITMVIRMIMGIRRAEMRLLPKKAHAMMGQRPPGDAQARGGLLLMGRP
jgi:hypothetical protein